MMNFDLSYFILYIVNDIVELQIHIYFGDPVVKLVSLVTSFQHKILILNLHQSAQFECLRS